MLTGLFDSISESPRSILSPFTLPFIIRIWGLQTIHKSGEEACEHLGLPVGHVEWKRNLMKDPR